MTRRLSLIALLWLLVAPCLGQANLPFSQNSTPIQGPDPTGEQGYPLAVVAATGALPFPVNVAAFLASVCVTQCTSPWIVGGTVTANQGTSPWITGFGGVGQPVNATQVTSPWITGFNGIRQPVDATQDTSPWITGFGGVGQPVNATQVTSPWITSFNGIGQPVNATQAGTWTVQQGSPPWSVSGTVTANQGTNPWVVSGTVTATGFPSATSVTLLASAARTVTTDSAAQSGGVFRRLAVIVSVTAGTGINLTPQLQIQDSISSDWITVWKGPGVNNIKDFSFLFADGASGGGNSQYTAVSSSGIPGSTWRFEMLAGNSNSVTYSVSGQNMP